jgi:hypothetical protein
MRLELEAIATCKGLAQAINMLQHWTLAQLGLAACGAWEVRQQTWSGGALKCKICRPAEMRALLKMTRNPMTVHCLTRTQKAKLPHQSQGPVCCLLVHLMDRTTFSWPWTRCEEHWQG